MQNPIDNTNLLTLGATIFVPGFLPAATYAYDSGAKTVTITDTTTFVAGDGLKILHISITDAFANKVYDKITVGAGNKVLDVSTLDPLHGLNLQVSFVTNKHYYADASAYNIGATSPAAGNVRYVNKVNC